MPILHRLACFRGTFEMCVPCSGCRFVADDVVFVVFLYQRYIYRVDLSRVNEYGQVAEGNEKDEKGETKKDK